MKEKQRQRLFDAVDSSYRKLAPFRRMQQGLIREYAGDGYGEVRDKRKADVVNLLHQTVEAYMMALAANRPRVLITSKIEEYKPFASHFQASLNNLLAEIGIERTIRRWVLDAFFCVGVVKCHMASSGLVKLEQDQWADPGQPFASNVSLDNFIYDISAVKWSEVQFAGDVYRIPWEDLQDEDVYIQDVAKDIQPSSKYEADQERTQNMSSGYEGDDDEYMSMVDLCDIWLPRDEKIETYACDFRSGSLQLRGEPVAEMQWEGSEFGPYKLLGFGDVPENIMPTSPASHLHFLATSINDLYRKQLQSARDYKENPIVPPGEESTGRNLQAAKHGQIITGDLTQVGNIKSGGIDQKQQMFLLAMMEDYNKSAGNLNALLGLGAQSDTVGQEKLIHNAVGGKTAAMADRVIEASTDLITDLGKMLWDDEVKIIPGERQVPELGSEYSVDASWMPGDREGSFDDYDMGIDVYSMAYKSPQDRAGLLLKILTEVYAPMVPLMMDPNSPINFGALNEELAELYDEPRLRRILRLANPEPNMGGGGAGGGGMPANTSREYTRRSQGSNQGQAAMQQQAWAAVGGE